MKLILRDDTKNVRFYQAIQMLNRDMMFFFAQNANILLVDFGVPLKRGLNTENKTSFKSVFSKHLLHYITEMHVL